MAKFYARLVLVTSALLVCAILSVFYVQQTMTGINVVLPDAHVLEISQAVGDEGTVIQDMFGSANGRLTLATDDVNTDQEFGWIETKQAKEMCSSVNYTGIPLPQMSVIICFHDKENMSNLLHTLHGVFQRTPPYLLKEVILIDDYSLKVDFGEILEIYTSAVFRNKVRIIRNSEKMGLIRARLKGIKAATTEVVAVMDSHVEVQPGWAEPLLFEIYKNPKTLAASYIDWMERAGGKWIYRHGGTNWKTYFDWTFVFGWQTMSDAEIKARKSIIEPIRTPVIIGTIYAIRKDYFFHVGAFDEGMQLWGGENIDLPVRIWLCGGRVVNVPCSRAGHMEVSGARDYRLSPQWENSKNANYKRFAEVWAGEFKKYFYMYTPEAEKAEIGEIAERMKLRSVCTGNFSWYLQEIYPELGIPDRDSLAWGELYNEGSQQCLDSMNNYFPVQGPCGLSAGRQMMYWSKSLHLRFPIHILNYNIHTEKAGIYMDEYINRHNTDSGSKYFHVKNGPILEMDQNRCLDASIQGQLQFVPCDFNSPFQKWHFSHYMFAYDELIQGRAHGLATGSMTLFLQNLQKFRLIMGPAG